MATAPDRPRRRTQAERREATRTALLDATIECLVAHGYAGTTTARVADMAGLSRGAQVHYFPSKAALVAAAVEHLAHRRIDELRGRLPDAGDMTAMLDVLWEAHQGAVFDATLELWVASRTDPELHAHLVALEAGVAKEIGAFIGTGDAAYRAKVMVALATVRGLALLRIAAGDDPKVMARQWKAARAQLVELF